MLSDDSRSSGLVSRRVFLRTASAASLVAATESTTLGAPQSAIDLGDLAYEPILESKKLRIGVVGGGFGTTFPWHAHPNCVVTAVADLREDRREKMKKTFGCDKAYGEFHPMLEDPKVDAVVIYTFAPDHARHCIDVMKAGKHAMSVIPAAVTLEDCQELVDTVKASGQIYMMGETSCFHPPTMLARRLFAEKRFGRVFYTEGEYTHDLFTDIEKTVKQYLVRGGKRTWRYGYPQGYYTGHANGPVIHVTRDRFTEVTAVGMPLDHEIYRDNQYNNPFVNTTFFFKTAGGNASRINIHWHTACPGGEKADYHGTKMSFFEPKAGQPTRVSFPGKTAKVIDVSGYRKTLPPSLRKTGGHGGSHAHIIQEFVSACLEGRSPAVDVYQAAAITAPGIVGFQSALKDGETLKVPDFGSMI